ncbi:RPM1 interacting protein 13-like [Musa acuminata AAA Group]|uniref:RPM1 interacting protein 13-like n=1 Tax=Musa acuminata AAA Group TaxID=214697 RepID=UPI0031D6AB73
MAPDIVDISSDEDEFDGLSLPRANGRRQEESDDVVVVEEFSAPAVKRRKQNSGSFGPEKGGASDDDDDCLVLDSDPDKLVSVVDGKGSGGGDGGDDLLIVAEKGQLACRDYPHPRHLCGNFPFNSSPHEEYCDLCHCYVCDSPAPCYFWGNGNSSSNHCHSTDKEGRWKSMRQSFKQKNMVPTQPQKVTYDSPFNIPPFRDPVPPFHHYPSPLLVPHSRPNLLRPCSATSISNSNAINQRHQDQPTILSYTRRLGQQPTKSCSLKSNVQIESCVAGSLTTQLVYSRTRYKRVGTMRDGFASQTNRSHNIASTKNNIPSAVSENSTYATMTSWRPRSPRVGQQRSQDLLGTSPGSSADQMQATISSQFSKPTNQSSVCPPLTAADVSQKSWQDLLASVASELGVAVCSDTDIINVQQPLMVPSLSLPHDKPFSETNASQDTQSD